MMAGFIAATSAQTPGFLAALSGLQSSTVPKVYNCTPLLHYMDTDVVHQVELLVLDFLNLHWTYKANVAWS